MTIVPDEYDLKSVVLTCYHLNERRAEENNLDFKLDVDPNLPKKLYGDSVRISQIITNLLTNAIKYTEEGEICFKLSGEKEDNAMSLKIEIADTGIGIREEDKDKLFSAFSRLDETRNNAIEGTGLGLAITGELIRLMNGVINVESTYGSGSVFSVTLPQGIIDDSPIGKVDTKAVISNAVTTISTDLFTAPNACVLVVDDVELNLKVFRGLLKKTLIKIDSATNGDDAIELVKNNKYDIILLDHMMPEKDGIETFHEIKDLPENPNENTPIIMLTANAVAGAREFFLEEGFTDYLAKPFTITEVRTAILRNLPSEKISYTE